MLPARLKDRLALPGKAAPGTCSKRIGPVCLARSQLSQGRTGLVICQQPAMQTPAALALRTWRAYKGLIPRAASQLGQPSVLATVSEVERALDFERSEGHTNMQGVGQKFNSYAAAQFEVIMARVQQDAEAAGRTAAAEGLVSACSKLSAMFKDYPRLVMWRRRELVQSGVSVVDGVRQLHLTLHPPRHLGDPTPGLPAQHPWPAQMARQPAANGTPAHAAEAVAPQQPNVAVKRVSEPQQAGLGQVPSSLAAHPPQQQLNGRNTALQPQASSEQPVSEMQPPLQRDGTDRDVLQPAKPSPADEPVMRAPASAADQSQPSTSGSAAVYPGQQQQQQQQQPAPVPPQHPGARRGAPFARRPLIVRQSRPQQPLQQLVVPPPGRPTPQAQRMPDKLPDQTLHRPATAPHQGAVPPTFHVPQAQAPESMHRQGRSPAPARPDLPPAPSASAPPLPTTSQQSHSRPPFVPDGFPEHLAGGADDAAQRSRPADARQPEWHHAASGPPQQQQQHRQPPVTARRLLSRQHRTLPPAGSMAAAAPAPRGAPAQILQPAGSDSAAEQLQTPHMSNGRRQQQQPNNALQDAQMPDFSLAARAPECESAQPVRGTDDTASSTGLLEAPEHHPDAGSASGEAQHDRPYLLEPPLVLDSDPDLSSLHLDDVASAGHQQDAQAQPVDGATVGKRGIKPETLRAKQIFALSAADAEQKRAKVAHVIKASVEQRSEEWRKLRKGRLTASSFANAIGGFFDRPGGDPDRVKLWKEQLKLIEPFKGNYATRHGNRNEERALSDYMLLSQHDVDSYGIKYLHDDDAHNWLAGSPDGLIDVPQAVSGGMPPSGILGDGKGLLEIKCPFKLRDSQPWQVPPAYYMPQVQGLMEIFKLEWCNLYCWTYQGSAVWHIRRDERYWGMCWQVLADYWWQHCMPASLKSREMEAQATQATLLDLQDLMPKPRHELTDSIIEASHLMAASAPAQTFHAVRQSQAEPRHIF